MPTNDSSLVVTLLGIIMALGGGAFAFLLRDRDRLLTELKASNSEKYETLAATAKVAEKVPDLVAQNQQLLLEVQRLNQRISDLERR